ncbi:HAD-IA family hydrolase [Actinoallomurus bryophytorum]|uniref:HAD superfamily hydrolase (TIGR01493 family)/HAD superfamily hydrolase (TIGR01509 family)/HAD superfamily hydrolase (TIGR01549 family) n=1 Tax=Actinoallomurus bryophytorum TaxID=1490222 RepID=A0A543C027_9ACTN|nr:HAD superfamily hydrolase (TIGR01493 family)/HAD superfamily hydrolase (TIGR01509 family)/HAD superfamily hydrolase (TIGR01549 family) [Actinoallomurus bryophytorum]
MLSAVDEPADARVEAVLFDFSGTLFDDTGVLDPPALVAAAERHHVPLGEREAAGIIRRTLRHVDSPEGLKAREGCDLSREAHRSTWTTLIAEAGPFGPDLTEALYECLTDPGAWHPYPDTVPVLTTLRDRGVRLGVLSNIGWDIRPAFDRVGVLESLHSVVLSCEHGLAKPDPALFALACERLGTDPGQVLYVGDDPVKDGAAVRAGLPVYLLPSDRNVRMPRGLAAVLRLVR